MDYTKNALADLKASIIRIVRFLLDNSYREAWEKLRRITKERGRLWDLYKNIKNPDSMVSKYISSLT